MADQISLMFKMTRVGCVERPKIPCAVLLSLSLTGPQSRNHEFPYCCQIFPAPLTHPIGKCLHIASSSVSCTRSGLQPNGFHLSASLRNYSNKQITSSHGNQKSPHPFVTTKLAFQSPCFLTLLLNALSPWGSEWYTDSFSS